RRARPPPAPLGPGPGRAPRRDRRGPPHAQARRARRPRLDPGRAAADAPLTTGPPARPVWKNGRVGNEQRVVVTTAEEARGLAIRERAYEHGREAAVEWLGPGMVLVTAPGRTAQGVADRRAEGPRVYPRHRTGESALLDPGADRERVAETAVATVREAGVAD